MLRWPGAQQLERGRLGGTHREGPGTNRPNMAVSIYALSRHLPTSGIGPVCEEAPDERLIGGRHDKIDIPGAGPAGNNLERRNLYDSVRPAALLDVRFPTIGWAGLDCLNQQLNDKRPPPKRPERRPRRPPARKHQPALPQPPRVWIMLTPEEAAHRTSVTGPNSGYVGDTFFGSGSANDPRWVPENVEKPVSSSRSLWSRGHRTDPATGDGHAARYCGSGRA